MRKLIILGVILICGGVSTVIYGKLTTYPVRASVRALTWQRSVQIDRFQAVQEDSLSYAVPAEAYDIHYYVHTWYEPRTCIDVSSPESNYTKSYECGNWESENRARYIINRWKHDYTLHIQGSASETRHWPDFMLPNRQGLGALRESNREEHLLVAFKAGDLMMDYRAPSVETWLSYVPQHIYTLQVNRFNEPLWETMTLIDAR